MILDLKQKISIDWLCFMKYPGLINWNPTDIYQMNL